MKALLLTQVGKPLSLQELPIPAPQQGQLLIKVDTCGVCRTDLHIYQGDLPLPVSPLILGHQIVGWVEKLGQDVQGWKVGDRVGIPWLASTCQKCTYCTAGKENLCQEARFTGYHVHGGFAEYTLCKADYAIALPSSISSIHLAPLLCAGLIGFRAYRKANPEKTIGFYGFGSSAHILIQIAQHEGKEVYVITRQGDHVKQAFAKKLGATWAGSAEELKESLDASIIFAPVGDLVPPALKSLHRGGRCVCAGIHMSDIPTFAYQDLFWEKSLSSVSHLTRQDALEFFSLLKHCPIETTVHTYPLKQGQQALEQIQKGNRQGSIVLQMGPS